MIELRWFERFNAGTLNHGKQKILQYRFMLTDPWHGRPVDWSEWKDVHVVNEIPYVEEVKKDD